MRAVRIVAALSLLAPSLAGAACRDDARLVAACFAVRAELRFYNGNPSFRLWPVGTRRLLGVKHDAEERPMLPAAVEAEVSAVVEERARLFADFTVCPLTRSRPGRMQMVCVETATRVRLEPRDGSKSSARPRPAASRSERGQSRIPGVGMSPL